MVEAWNVEVLPMKDMDELFPQADATEESVLNALCAAETMTGHRSRVAHAVPLDLLRELAGTE
jgi:D-aminopeptidase